MKNTSTQRTTTTIFKTRKINFERFLNSWEVTVKHTKEHIQPFPADKPRKPKAKEPGEPDSVRITTSGLYILFIGGARYEGIPNALGELAKGEELTDDMDDLDLDPSPPKDGGKGTKVPAGKLSPSRTSTHSTMKTHHLTRPWSKYSPLSSASNNATSPIPAWPLGKRGWGSMTNNNGTLKRLATTALFLPQGTITYTSSTSLIAV
jgi:hypothetical protein